mgnify:FL=1
MKTILSFGIKYTPMEKLAIINFEKKPDSIYKGLELQYLNSTATGSGYRVLAYRNDGCVDMFDDPALIFNPDEQCDVAEKGLNRHIQTKIENVVFEKIKGCVEISFDFVDLQNRPIHVLIKEQTKRNSTPMNLLAPIGVGSEKPSSLPVFFLYEFDFIRRRKTNVDIHIDNKKITLDPFPVPTPMNGQLRYYSRYTLESQIIDFLPHDMNVKEIELDEQLQYTQGSVRYQFTQTGLSKMELIHNKKVAVHFNPAIAPGNGSGEFSIRPPEEMGYIEGSYQVKRDGDIIDISLCPDKGWTSAPNSIITKMILSPKSVFCSWLKKYQYAASINLSNKTVNAKWVNKNKR